MSFLEVKQLSCRYDEATPILNNISFTLREGGLASLLGPSGCGKTTLLRAIAGFQTLDNGEISLKQQLLSAHGVRVPPEKRRVGMIFQDFSLFPHLNVFDNICFGIAHLRQVEKKRIADELLAMMGLKQYANAYPNELSGGQQQRVAIARSLAVKPKLMLMDEPFSSLDKSLRRQLNREIRNLFKEQNIAAILVTHDLSEALEFADEVGLMREGAIEQWSTPYELYHLPKNAFVAQFTGLGAFIDGEVLESSSRCVQTNLGVTMCSTSFLLSTPGSKVRVFLRPEDVVYHSRGQHEGVIVDKTFKGATILYQIRHTSGDVLYTICQSHLNFELGDRFPFELSANHLITFPD